MPLLAALGLTACGSADAARPEAAASGVGAAGGASASHGGTGGGGGEDPGAVLDPAEVYVVGPFKPATCNTRGLLHWAAQDTVSLGFDCSCEFDDAMIRPADGRLLMTCAAATDESWDAIREFHCDECPYEPGTLAYLSQSDSMDNDPVLPSPCNVSVLGFRLGPENDLYYRCDNDVVLWLDESGAPVVDEDATDDRLVQPGYGRRLLTTTRIVDLDTMTSVPLTGLPEGEITASRAVAPDGFVVVVYVGPPGEYGDEHELWQVDGAGVSSLVGVYAPGPAGSDIAAKGRLEAGGALLQMISNTPIDPLEDPVFAILRRDVRGASEIVYTEASGPLVKIAYEGFLVSGP